MKQQAALFLLAVQFLTRIPIPVSIDYSEARMNASARYYPLVGCLVGGVCAAVFWLGALMFPALVALALSIAAGLLLTGAFHEDGLADTFDGIGGGHDRAQSLAIMKDSRLGTYGTLALITALGLKFISLAALPVAWILTALIVSHGLSRLSSVLVIATSTYARTEGKAKPVTEGLTAPGLAVAGVTGIAGLAASLLALPAAAIGVGLIGLIAGHVGMRLLYERKLQGYTGDTLGAVQQASEIGFYLGLVAWIS
nr:adenosylcobinamide-GDP ribazoletransferase [Hyphomonas sp. Mor2]